MESFLIELLGLQAKCYSPVDGVVHGARYPIEFWKVLLMKWCTVCLKPLNGPRRPDEAYVNVIHMMTLSLLLSCGHQLAD